MVSWLWFWVGITSKTRKELVLQEIVPENSQLRYAGSRRLMLFMITMDKHGIIVQDNARHQIVKVAREYLRLN